MPIQPFYVPDFLVKIAGLTLEADVTRAVMGLTYDNSLNTADMFTLQLNNADLRFTDSALFEVGKTVEIYLGYVNNLQPMMLGEITAIQSSFPQSGAPMLTVTGYDKSHRLRHNQPDRPPFQNLNDSAIAARVAAENLLVPIVDPAPMPPQDKVPQTGSDWALLKELAERNYFQVFVRWDKLYFRFPRPQTEIITLEWGKNLSSFSPRLSTSGLAGVEVVRGYDEQLAQEIVAVLPVLSLGADLDQTLERLGSSVVEQLVGLGRHVIRDRPVANFLDATVLAKSMLTQLLEGLYEASGSCIGLPELRAGDRVEIRGVGKRFSGQYTLSRVTHTLDQSGYQTHFEVSQKETSTLLQSLRKKIAESPSPNHQEKIYGVLVGKVQNNFDRLHPDKIPVYLPNFNFSVWARLATPMAGANKGTLFVPEPEDDVLVAFEHGDIRAAIIVGSLWNGLNLPPERKAQQQGQVQIIRTKAGHAIAFDNTSGKEQVVIKDKAGSVITLHPNGTVSIEAAKDLELNAPNGDVNITTNNVNVQVSGVMDVR